MFSQEDTEQTSSPPRSASRRQERQQEFREATRRAILDAALELFVADGYSSVSMRSIAAKVDYSPAAIYGYFPSKDDIFFTLAEEGFKLLGHRELAAVPAADPLDDVRGMLWRLYEFSKEQPQYFALVFLDRRVPRIGREYERFAFLSELRAKTLSRIQQCVASGALPASLHVMATLRLLFAPVLGLAALRLSNRLAPWEDADVLVRQSIDVTLAGLKVHPPTGDDGPEGTPETACSSGR